ncbi:MAG: peptide deformylase [Bacteroidales bacterium]|nr:peptide deformylase [Bacteroidales bacterium]
MIQPIYLYGSEVLRRKAPEADLSKKEELSNLIGDLKDTLSKADGCGLAAPQIGVSLRVVIVDGRGLSDNFPELHDFFRVIINPVVLEESTQKCEYSEGCLSVPGIYADVLRPSRIKLSYYNENFEQVTEEFCGFGCRMVQHELSHLDGVLFTDLVSPIRKKMIGKKLLNVSKGKVSTAYNVKIK